ncbi:MAG TPA: hypothetical protein VMQ62_11405 [Dongiaceae bacterium]|nr:hypothetical protein [Dongiaceae bacterium]
MPRAATLLRLYPPAWRARYGDEFLATVGEAPLESRQVFDIVMVAIDAWLSADVRKATRAYRVAPSGGGSAMLKSMLVCGRRSAGVTPRDGLVGAAVMILATLLFSVAGIAARRAGWSATGEMLKGLAFAGPFTLSMPFWLMKGQPWKAQAAIIGGTMLILIAAGLVATRV